VRFAGKLYCVVFYSYIYYFATHAFVFWTGTREYQTVKEAHAAPLPITRPFSYWRYIIARKGCMPDVAKILKVKASK
jgi:hypothetical protein